MKAEIVKNDASNVLKTDEAIENNFNKNNSKFMAKKLNKGVKESVDSLKKVSNFELYVWTFFLGCFLGYVVEVGYAYIQFGYFINKQGMIYGPFNQVYGFGAVLFTLCLYKFMKCKSYILFIAGSLIGGLFEYLCSYLQEVMFKSESWSYGDYAINFNGRTNPIHAMFWGILGIFFFRYVFPYMLRLILLIPKKVRAPLTWLVLVFMVLNMTISALAVYRQSQRVNNIPASNAFEEFLDKHYTDEKLKKVYTGMTFHPDESENN